MYTKVSIKLASKRARKRHWWVRCQICNVKSHFHLRSWDIAMAIALEHAGGKRHANALLKEQRRGTGLGMADDPVEFAAMMRSEAQKTYESGYRNWCLRTADVIEALLKDRDDALTLAETNARFARAALNG